VNFSPAYRRYVLALLTLGYTANYLDRQVLSILMQPIKLDLALSDTQLGFLSGITFAIFYATLGVPIALWADRVNRRNIIALSLTVFSSMTVLCGFASNFVQLALARIGVGVGEAGSSPPSYSIISDIYPPEQRGSAIGIYALGINFGVLIGFLVGGWLSQWYDWRIVFIVVGAPGLLIALLVRFTLREPVRGLADGVKEATPIPPIRQVFALLWRQRSFRHISLGCALSAFVGYGTLAWFPSYLSRSFQMSQGEIATYLALIIGIVGGAGTYLSGWIADRLSKGGDLRWYMWTVALIALTSFPFAVAQFLTTHDRLVFLLFLLPAFAGSAFMGPCFAMTQALVSLRMRAVASAMLLFILNLIGMGLGPQMVGILSDIYASRFGLGDESLRYALLTIMSITLWSCLHFYLASRTLRQDVAHAAAAPGLPQAAH